MALNLFSSSKKVYNSGLEIEKGSNSDVPNLRINDPKDNYTIGADYYINPKHTLSFESNAKGLIFGESNFNDISNIVSGIFPMSITSAMKRNILQIVRS